MTERYGPLVGPGDADGFDADGFDADGFGADGFGAGGFVTGDSVGAGALADTEGIGAGIAVGPAGSGMDVTGMAPATSRGNTVAPSGGRAELLIAFGTLGVGVGVGVDVGTTALPPARPIVRAGDGSTAPALAVGAVATVLACSTGIPDVAKAALAMSVSAAPVVAVTTAIRARLLRSGTSGTRVFFGGTGSIGASGCAGIMA